MKTQTSNHIILAACVLLAATTHQARTESTSISEQISSKPVFASRLKWVGSQGPSESESEALLIALNSFDSGSVKGGYAALERFLSDHPRSPWAPSLHLNVIDYYRRHGQCSLVLAHLEAAWNATREMTDPKGKQLADCALVSWLQMLGSIGNTESMRGLFDETRQRIMEPKYQEQYRNAWHTYFGMQECPQFTHKCGVYALDIVAKQMFGTNDYRWLLGQFSPRSGFSLAALQKFAAKRKLGLVAVRRPPGAEIVVPSVVHWKVNHYAAIVEKRGGGYLVIDPAFGGRIAMETESIDAEASGAFLVPQDKAPISWAQLSEAECQGIYGGGGGDTILDDGDRGDPSPDPCDDYDYSLCDLPSANDGAATDGGPSSGGCCDSQYGMPQWSVSEPFITLWLTDKPLSYRLSNGRPMVLLLRYKDRGITSKSANISSFGDKWECNWLDMLQSDGGPIVTNFLGTGGLLGYETNGTPEYQAGNTIDITHANEIVKLQSEGYQWYEADRLASLYYAMLNPLPGVTNYLMTQKVSSLGRKTLFNYVTNGSCVLLTNVVDLDGRTNYLSYSNTAFPNLITAVTNPYGFSAHFVYDQNGWLTNIVDSMGMSSSFNYDELSNMISMTTPYGTTAFQTTNGTGGQGGIRRALLVTEAAGDQQLYAYCDDGTYGVCNSAYDGNGATFRNSFHWNRAQYNVMNTLGITNILDMPASYYSYASTKHWLHGSIEQGTVVSDTLDATAGPLECSAGVTNRFGYMSFAYQGEASESAHIGTNKAITEIDAFAPMDTPGGQVEGTEYVSIQRNSAGHPTNINYYNPFLGPTASYMNWYDPSGTILLEEYGPNGEQTRGYGYDTVLTNLLMSVTNALGGVIRYTYDTNLMKLTSTTMPSGLVRSNIYYTDGACKGFLAVQMDIGIRTNSFGYQNGNLATQTNELGLVTTYVYDNLNRLISTAYPDGTTVSNVYDKLDLVATKDRLTQWTYYVYDQVRQLRAITNVNGQISQYDYCGCGSPSQLIRWNGTTALTTTFSYDGAGRLTNVIYPDQYELNYTYYADNSTRTVTDSGANNLSLQYSQLGLNKQVHQVSLGDGVLMQQWFDEYGRLTNSVDRNGIITTNSYDFLNRLTSRQTFDPWYNFVSTETFAYTTRGLTNYTDALTNSTTFVRDLAGRLLYETNANNEVLGFIYNPSDELLQLTDGKKHTTTWDYDQYGRVKDKIDALNDTLFTYGYDPLDRLTNRWSSEKGTTVYKYDPVGNLTNVDYSGGTVPTPSIYLSYDGLNRLTNMVDGAGVTVFTWTDGDQLATEDGPWASDTVSYSYSNRQRSRVSVLQPNASLWAQTYLYDEVMRLTNVVSPAGNFDYRYDNGDFGFGCDRVQSVTLPGGDSDANTFAICNSYDQRARLSDTVLYTQPNTMVNRHTYPSYPYVSYDAASQVLLQKFINGNYINYTYDNIGQLKTAQGWEANGSTRRLHEQFGYAYDAAWNLQYRTNNVLVQTFTVNSLNELTSASRSGTLTVAGAGTESPGSPGLTSVTVSGTGLSSGAATLYSDGSWARAGATLADGSNSYTATAQDSYGRQASSSVTVNLPESTTYTYDQNGNLTNNGTLNFAYDDENQLTSAWLTNAWRSDFVYDGLMRRRVRIEYSWNGSQWVTNAITRYVYDGMLVIQERDGNNLPQVTYTRGNDLSGSLQGAGGIGGLLARSDNAQLITQNSPGAHACYHCDGNGNVTAMVNGNGAVVARYEYDPYGNILALSGPLANGNLYRFSSKEWHPNSGLVYYGFRFYSPSLQRWLNRDPLSMKVETTSPRELGVLEFNSGGNLYHFVNNAPPFSIDAYGLNVYVIEETNGWHHQVVLCGSNGKYWATDLMPGNFGGVRLRTPNCKWLGPLRNRNAPIAVPAQACNPSPTPEDPSKNDIRSDFKITREVICSPSVDKQMRDLVESYPPQQWNVLGHNCYDYANTLAGVAAHKQSLEDIEKKVPSKCEK